VVHDVSVITEDFCLTSFLEFEKWKDETVENIRFLRAYKDLKRDLNRMIREAKKDCWKKLCQELDNNIWGMAYKIVAKKLNSLTPYEIDDDRKKTNKKDIELFTLKELEAAAANIKCGKAPGPDQIPPEAVKIMAECLPNWILAVMNTLLEKQEFPNKWKEARVVPLCMLNVLSKLLEILIKNRLQEELEVKGGLHPNQYSYQKGKSTIQAIEEVIETVRDYKCKCGWMKEHKLTLAPQKTEAIILGGKRNIGGIKFNLEGVEITPSKTLRYLGITLDEKLSFRRHIQCVTAKAEDRVAGLTRILPNIGPKGRCSSEWLQHIKLSAVALQIITGTIPTDLLVKERAYAQYHRQEETREVKERARDNSLIAWQQRWESETAKAQWTKRLFPNITQWIKCEHRTANYHLTQVMSGHGSFRSFAKRIKKDASDECMYCGEEDTAENTIFKCSRWRENRDSAYQELGRELTPETLVMTMITSDTAWKTTFNMIKTIMSAKEKEEMARQERERREN
ncbi:hypothetical protein NQ317_006081, partial [Molorchus minor]